jgi:hypothetical protein
MSDPTGTTGTTSTEVALRSRLEELAGTASVDDQAWEKIQNRIAGGHSASGRRRPTPRQLIAVAAAVILVCAIVWARRDSGQKVETVDDTTTTTTDRVGRESTTTTSTTVAGGPSRSETGPGGQPTGGPASGGAGPGSGGDPAGQPGDGGASPEGGTSPGGGGPATGAPPASSVPPPSGNMPDGRPPAVTFEASGYTLQATFWRIDEGTLYLNLWRPDRGYLANWSRSDRPGQNCLAGESEYPFDFPEPGSHAYSWGLVRADAAEVRIVSTTGESRTAAIGSVAVPGLRPWIAPSPSGQVDHYEARDASGAVLHVAASTTGTGGQSFDAMPDTC